MVRTPLHQIKIVAWSATEDSLFWEQLSRHLEALKYQRLITLWHPQEISPGMQVREIFHAHLQEADLILPLVSSYMLSAICGSEMEQALQRSINGEVTIIPVLLRPCDYQGTPINQLPFLPEKGKAITQWSNRQNAMLDTAKGIRHAVEILLAQKWKSTGDLSYDEKQYEQALCAYEQALVFNPCNPSLHTLIGELQFSMTHFEQALTSYKRALQFEPHNPFLHRGIGETLFKLGRFEEAIAAYEQAISLKPDFGLAYWGHANALEAHAHQLSREYKQQARESYKKARLLHAHGASMQGATPEPTQRNASARGKPTKNPSSIESSIPHHAAFSRGYPTRFLFINRILGNVFLLLRLFAEALLIYEYLIHLEPHNVQNYYSKEKALIGLQRFDEAITTCNEAISLYPASDKAYQNRGKVYEDLAERISRKLIDRAQQSHKKAQVCGFKVPAQSTKQ
jgi:tetratricopeptide (TPR) repeat protein